MRLVMGTRKNSGTVAFGYYENTDKMANDVENLLPRATAQGTLHPQLKSSFPPENMLLCLA